MQLPRELKRVLLGVPLRGRHGVLQARGSRHRSQASTLKGSCKDSCTHVQMTVILAAPAASRMLRDGRRTACMRPNTVDATRLECVALSLENGGFHLPRLHCGYVDEAAPVHAERCHFEEAPQPLTGIKRCQRQA